MARDVLIRLNRLSTTGKVPANAAVRFEPTVLRADADGYILDDYFDAVMVDGEATVTDLPETDLNWAYKVQIRGHGRGAGLKQVYATWYVHLPAGEGAVNFEDLPRIDPTTLTPVNDPDPAWVDAVTAVFSDSISTAVEPAMVTAVDDETSQFRSALNAATAEVVEKVAIQRTLESFGARGDGVTNDATAVNNALSWATGATGRRLVGTAGRTYRIAHAINIPAGTLVADFHDSTLAFTDGAALRGTMPQPFLSTTSTAGVTRKATKFIVTDATGVQKGDFVAVRSPVEWVAGINMEQHYLIQDVDTATGEVWVEGRIVGDITPAQITMAGLAGSVTVDFYRLAENVHLSNLRIVSPNRDAAIGGMLSLRGYARGRLDNITVDKPNRNGVEITMCGHITVNNPDMSEFGWVVKDEGYVNLAHHPSGAGYGYGFVVSNTATVVFRDPDIKSGWHGIDVARGVSNALIISAVAHKNAFAFSTHEGAWVLEIRASRIFGGMGVISRGSDLIISGCRIEGSLDRAIIGQGTHQYLSISDTTIDMGGATSRPFGFTETGGYSAATRSAEPSYTELTDVTITGITQNGVMSVTGNLTVDRLRLRAGLSGGSSEVKFLARTPGAKAKVSGLDVEGVRGQFGIELNNFATVELLEPHASGPVPVYAGSAMVSLRGTQPVDVTIKGGLMNGFNQLVRVFDNAAATFDIVDCTVKTGRLVLGGTASRIRNVINNQTPAAELANADVTVTNSVGNVVLADL